jgi:hypothetical protein
MKFFRNFDENHLFFMWMVIVFLGAGVGIGYQNFLDYQLNLHVLQCIEKTQNPEPCNKVIKK